MSILTLKVMAGLLQLHGPGATIQSDHPGIDALLGDMRAPGGENSRSSDQVASDQVTSDQMTADDRFTSDQPLLTEAYFRRGFVRGAPYYGGGFRRGAVGPYGGFRRGFGRGY
jgi:hypothetical protein